MFPKYWADITRLALYGRVQLVAVSHELLPRMWWPKLPNINENVHRYLPGKYGTGYCRKELVQMIMCHRFVFHFFSYLILRMPINWPIMLISRENVLICNGSFQSQLFAISEQQKHTNWPTNGQRSNLCILFLRLKPMDNSALYVCVFVKKIVPKFFIFLTFLSSTFPLSNQNFDLVTKFFSLYNNSIEYWRKKWLG